MSSRKISQLESGAPAQLLDLFVIARGSANYNLTLSDIISGGNIVTNGGTVSFAPGTVSSPSITTTGDPNTGLYFPAADTIAVTTVGTERMRIDSSGRVGIGTSLPDYPLSIQSAGDAQLSLKNSSGTSKSYIGTAGIFGSASADDLRIRSEATNIIFGFFGTETMRLTSGGNVVAGGSVALSTAATDGFLYVPTCAGTPTGTPTAITGMAPIVVNTTNNKLYFYSGGSWRDAGP